MSKQRRLSGSLALSKLKHVLMTKKGKKDKKTGEKKDIEGIFIPIDINYLTRGKEGAIYLNLSLVVKDEEDKFGQHGFIGQNADSDTYKKLKKKGGKKFDEIRKLPILGNVKDFENSGGSQDNSGAAGSKIDEDDDLPF